MAAPDLQLCTADDVINFCFAGDQAEALKLSKLGAWSASVLTEPIKAASADVETACGNKFDLQYSADVTVYPYHLRKLAALRAGYYFWLFRAKGMGCPENLKREVTDPDLQLLRDGKIGAGTQKPPASRVTSAHVVDITQGGTVPRFTLRGFGMY